MNIALIQDEFKKKVSEKIEIVSEGKERFRIFTPFMFADGDHLVSVLKKLPRGWVISDEAHTYMHLSYELDMANLNTGTRQKIISASQSMFNLEESNGEMMVTIENDMYGDALYSFIQGILKITDINYLSRERVISTFMEDFTAYLTEKIPENRRVFNYFNKEHDPEGKYIVDCQINGMKNPIFVFAISSDARCKDATINCLKYEKWAIKFRPLAIYEDMEKINIKDLARFSDVCEKQFSSLYLNKDRIANYLQQQMQEV